MLKRGRECSLTAFDLYIYGYLWVIQYIVILPLDLVVVFWTLRMSLVLGNFKTCEMRKRRRRRRKQKQAITKETKIRPLAEVITKKFTMKIVEKIT
jgi:hypothetical protein